MPGVTLRRRARAMAAPRSVRSQHARRVAPRHVACWSGLRGLWRTVGKCYRVPRGMLNRGMAARQRSGLRFRRVTLYLTPLASDRLDGEAVRRSSAAGVEVSPEAAARGLVYSGLGLSVDGNGDAVSPVTELVAAVRAVVDHGMKQPIGAPEAKPKLIEMAEALIRLERSLKR